MNYIILKNNIIIYPTNSSYPINVTEKCVQRAKVLRMLELDKPEINVLATVFKNSNADILNKLVCHLSYSLYFIINNENEKGYEGFYTEMQKVYNKSHYVEDEYWIKYIYLREQTKDRRDKLYKTF